MCPNEKKVIKFIKDHKHITTTTFHEFVWDKRWLLVTFFVSDLELSYVTLVQFISHILQVILTLVTRGPAQREQFLPFLV